MTLQSTMNELEAAGTAQNRKVYARHGAKEPSFGVSFATLRKLARIEQEIHPRKIRTKHAMNTARCAIGIGREALREEAVRSAKRIRKVEVDHGETGCKTPDAVAYIQRAAKRKRE